MKSKGLSILLIGAGLGGRPAGALADDAGRVQQWLLAGRFSDPAPAKLLANPPAAPATLAPSAGDAVGFAAVMLWILRRIKG